MLNGLDKLKLSNPRKAEVSQHINRNRNQLNNDLVRAYRWVIAPAQRDPQQAEYTLNAVATRASENGEVIRSADEKLISDEKLVDAIAPSQLARYLKEYIWTNDNDHITIDALWDLFTSHVYFPRLRNASVLEEAIQRGTANGDFGYADQFDGDNYENLRFKEPIESSHASGARDRARVIVEPEMADLQKSAGVERSPGGPVYGPPPLDPDPEPTDPPAAPAGPSLITATKQLQGDISLDAISGIQNEIIRNITDDGGDVTVTITVSASKSGGFSQNTVRAIRENGDALQLELQIDDSGSG